LAANNLDKINWFFMYLSENFTFEEFERSEIAEKYNIDNKITKDFIRNNIKELVSNVLQPLRDKIDKPITISSGYRCLQVNKKAGGVPTSQHVMGQAADIMINGMTSYEIASMIIEMGLPFDQIGLYDNFVHVSVSSRQRNMIFYSKNYSGKRLS
jgi:uncharacterized protein YcbK (DUF882 family)